MNNDAAIVRDITASYDIRTSDLEGYTRVLLNYMQKYAETDNPIAKQTYLEFIAMYKKKVYTAKRHLDRVVAQILHAPLTPIY